jgi:hypothetical protein
LKQFT